MSVHDVTVRITGQLDSSFQAALNGAKGGLSALGLASRAGKALIGATTGALVGAGTALIGLGKHAFDVGGEFDAAMSKAAATSGATGVELAAVRDLCKDLGKTTTKTATESAQAFEYMALAGWNVQDSMAALPQVLTLSEATGLDLARASDLVTDSMSAAGIAVEDLGGYLDLMAQAQRSSNQTADAFMEGIIGCAGAARVAGVGTQDLTTALGILANNGVKAAEGGTAMNAIFANFADTSGQAYQALQNYNVEIFDAQGNFVGLEQSLVNMKTAMAGMTQQEQEAFLKAVAGKPHMKSLAALIDSVGTSAGDAASAWGQLSNNLDPSMIQGVMQAMRDTNVDNLFGDIEGLKSAWETVGIEIFDNMEALGGPALRELVQFGTQCFQDIADAAKTGDFSQFATAIGDNLALALQKGLELVPQFIEMSTQLVEAILTGLESNAGPIGQAAGAVIAKIGEAFVRIAPRLIVVGAKLLVEIANGIAQNIGVLWPAIQEAGKVLLQGLGDAFSSLGKTILENIGPILKALTPLAGIIPAVAGGFLLFKKIKGTDGPLKSFMSKLFGIGKAGKQTTKGLDGAGSAMSSLGKNVLGIGGGIALAAGGLWLLSDAAIRIADAGPGAAVAMGAMVAGLGGLMMIAGKVAPELRFAGNGFLTFGAAVLMCAGAMWIMADAAVKIGQVGPQANIALGLMVGGLAGLMWIAGTVGPVLSRSTSGLLAFGGAVLMAAAGMWVMADAAAKVGAVGPQANIALGLIVAGLAGLMGVAGLVGPALQSAAGGLLAFGGAVLMAGAGMWVMAEGAARVGEVGPQANIALGLIVAGLAGLMGIAGAVGPAMQAAAGGLLAFGGAVLMAGAGMWVLADGAARIGEVGPQANIALGIMTAGLAGLMGIAGLVGPALNAAAVGLLAFGAAILMASFGMSQMASAAVMLAEAGAGAQVALAVMLAGMVGIGAIAGAMAPLLLAGAAALAALGGALYIVAGAFQALMAPAQTAMNLFRQFCAMLPLIGTYGTQAGTALTVIAGAMLELAAGAAAVGACGLGGGLGLFAFAAGAWTAKGQIEPVANAMKTLGEAVNTLKGSGDMGAASIKALGEAAKSAKDSLKGIDQAFTPLATALQSITGPAQSANSALAPLAATFMSASMSVAAIVAGMQALVAVLQLSTMSAAMFATASSTIQTTAASLAAAFSIIAATAPTAGAAMQSVAIPATLAAAAFMQMVPALTIAAGMLAAISAGAAAAGAALSSATAGAAAFAAAISGLQASAAALSAIMATMIAAVAQAWAAILTATQSGVNAAMAAVSAGMNATVAVVQSAMNRLVAAVRSGGNQAVAAARSAANGIQSAFSSINLSGAGAHMMRGLVNGINSMRGAVTSAAQSIAQAAASAVNSALKIHSPSRVMVETGQFVGEGLAQGVQARAPYVERVAQSALVAPILGASAGAVQGATDSTADLADVLAGAKGDDSASWLSGALTKLVALAGYGGNAAPQNQPQPAPSNPTFVFSPNYNISGNADQETLERMNKLSQREFGEMFRTEMRKLDRAAFGVRS